ncbi:MAG TPA: tripartite tricarboxylate transporter TctB family protein [Geminicoccaceae bacterium]|nr:tripartite tricarboxylate transporter TctB family protein [Geminicoccaceae bacterium]
MTVRTAELLMAIALTLLSIAFMVKSMELNIGWVAGRGPGAGAWPFWLSVGMLLTSLATLFRWFRRITPESRSSEIFMSRAAVSIVGTAVAALTALLIGIHTIGIYLSLILFLIFFVRIVGRHSWFTTLAIALLTPVLVFCLFEWALTIPLPKAISEPLFYPIYDLMY